MGPIHTRVFHLGAFLDLLGCIFGCLKFFLDVLNVIFGVWLCGLTREIACNCVIGLGFSWMHGCKWL